ncbi:unnamed protein product [Oppiella nova]|nr:unnamed protein product [Oppiella nova]CAG2170544.1 unnamed protein product [Oppiella nova]
MLRSPNVALNLLAKSLTASTQWPIAGTAVLSVHCHRCLSGKPATSDDSNDHVDRVSPTGHPVSNLRLIHFGRPANETPPERELRLKRSALQKWNHEYWLKNNADFQRQKSDYIERELKALRGQEFKSSLSYDELSLFYKSFLDSNHKKHMNYNL